MEERWVIGVDGGGSKTAFSCRELTTGRTQRHIDKSICPNDHGVEGYLSVMINSLNAMHIDAERVVSVCLGIPCFGEYPSLDEKVSQATSGLFGNAIVLCENDCVVGFAGAFALKSGINVVCGKDDKGDSARSNGWSDEFSDEGSGFWMGRRLFSTFARQSDGRMSKSRLYYPVKSRLSIADDFEIIDYF